MDLEVFRYPVPFCIIRNFLSPEKYGKIKKDLDYLEPYLKGTELTGAAKLPNHEFAVKRKGMFLNEFSHLRGNTGINSVFDTLVDPVNLKQLMDSCWFGAYLENQAMTGTLISLYQEGDEYKPHRDRAILSIIYYVFDGEFEGGDFFLQKVKVPIENNSLIIFPSCVQHAVAPVKGPGKRWSVTTFFNVKNDYPTCPDVTKFRNFLTPEEWNTVQDIIQSGDWKITSPTPDTCKVMSMDLTNHKFFSEVLFNKIPHGPWELECVYALGQTTGLHGEFFREKRRESNYTFIINATEVPMNFLNSWGGQIEFETEHGRVSEVPETNLAMLFKSNLSRRYLAPSRYVNTIKVMIEWKLKKK
jgi:hypothetical protein